MKERVRFLWAKLSVACRQPGLLEELEIERNKHLDRNFGLRGIKMLVESDEEIDIVDTKHKIVTLREALGKKTLPWYLLSDESTFSKTQKIFVQIMTWSTIIVTPLTFLFPSLKAMTNNYEWFVDTVWCFEIFISFFKGHLELAPTFEASVRRYMRDGPLTIGAFWFDFISTIPPMIMKEESMIANAFKFLRLYHF